MTDQGARKPKGRSRATVFAMQVRWPEGFAAQKRASIGAVQEHKHPTSATTAQVNTTPLTLPQPLVGLSSISRVSCAGLASPAARPHVQLAQALRPAAPTSQSLPAARGMREGERQGHSEGFKQRGKERKRVLERAANLAHCQPAADRPAERGMERRRAPRAAREDRRGEPRRPSLLEANTACCCSWTHPGAAPGAACPPRSAAPRRPPAPPQLLPPLPASR